MKNILLQVQPQWENREQWMALSLREGLFFEALEFSLPPANDDPAACARLADWYRAGGRTTAFHGAFMDVNPACGDPALRALSRRRCHESCRLAAELGAGYVVFHASAHPFLRGAYLENWAAECADFYAELSETHGIALRIENSLDVDCTPLQALMKRIRGGDVALCLDIGHAHYSRMPVEAWFDRLGGHIRCMHLSDNNGLFDDHLPIGAGSVDWEKVNAMWAQLDGNLPMTLEVGGMQGVQESLAFLRGRGYFGLKENRPDED